jgi:multimeric flavodoxin WrbA
MGMNKSISRRENMKPKVVGIVGSPRAGGNTEQFMKIALDEIKSKRGIDTELILLKDKEIKPCIHCRVCRTGDKATCSIKDDFLPIFKKMVKADGVLLGSPVYFGSAYSKLKALFSASRRYFGGIFCMTGTFSPT